MQSEIIFIPNTKIFTIENKGGYLTINLDGTYKPINNLEPLGFPFSIITKRKVNKFNSFEYTTEFKQLANPIPIMSTLEYYLREANIEFTLSKRDEEITQYIGLMYGKSATIEFILNLEKEESEIKRNVIPCQFYLIKDKI
jgi:hypothetical protein